MRPRGGFQLRHPNPDLMALLIYHLALLENSRKGFACCAPVRDRCSCREQFLKSFFGFPKRKRKESKPRDKFQSRFQTEHYSDFAFYCKSDIRILTAKSRFSDRTHSTFTNLGLALWRSSSVSSSRKILPFNHVSFLISVSPWLDYQDYLRGISFQ